MSNETASGQIINTGRELLSKGLVARTWGNISCRIHDEDSNYEDGSYLITASGRDYMTMTPDETVEIGLNGYKYESNYMPSMEYKIHGAVYKIREDVNFIIHTHQSSASVVSAMGLDTVNFKKEYEGIGSFVLCAAYGMPGSLRLYGNVTKAVKEAAGNAIILRNHGAICFGKDKEEAMRAVLNLETACSEFIQSIGVEPWNQDNWDPQPWFTNSVIEKYTSIRSSLPSYIDDFSQMIGPELPILESFTEEDLQSAEADERPLIVKGKGVFCCGEDKDAMALVIDKNFRAALASLGVKPLDSLRSIYMNRLYRKKYSKLK